MRFISSFRISYQHHQEEHHHHRRQLPSSRSQALGMKVAAAAPATPFRGPVTPRNSPIGFSLPARRFSRLGYTVRWCRRYPLSYSQWKSCEILSALANSNFPPLRSSRSQSRANFTEITETLSGGLSRIRYDLERIRTFANCQGNWTRLASRPTSRGKNNGKSVSPFNPTDLPFSTLLLKQT